MNQAIRVALEQFQAHYQRRFGAVTAEISHAAGGLTQFRVNSPLLRAGNAPRIFHHHQKTPHVIVLLHGLTDSPYYMEAIAKRFYAQGVNVILPLLPAHGLQNPEAEIKVSDLSRQWKDDVDHIVCMASLMGATISLGGLSMGGALSLNQVLRHPGAIQGGLFLFSAALDIGTGNERVGELIFKTLKSVEIFESLLNKTKSGLSWIAAKPTAPYGDEEQITSKVLSFLAARFGFAGHQIKKVKNHFQTLLKNIDKDYQGQGPNPYKYPVFSLYAALHLTEIIRENNLLLQKTQLKNPVFAAHSAVDDQALYEGLARLFEHHGGYHTSILFSENLNVKHAEVVLESDILMSNVAGPAVNLPKANPDFEGMMRLAISFFQQQVLTQSPLL